MYLAQFSKFRILVLVVLFLAGTFVYTASNRFVDQQRIGNDYHELVHEVDVLRQEKAELENVRDFALTDIFVEQQARLLLGFIRGHETAFVVTGQSN